MLLSIQHEDQEQRYMFEDEEFDTTDGTLEYPKANRDYARTQRLHLNNQSLIDCLTVTLILICV